VNLRSEDWSVRPSFVPHGPTSPVTLLADDEGLTQLAGIPPVAWQTPWSEIGQLELVRFAHQMALFATIGGVRYCWRHRELGDYEALRALVLSRGGEVTFRRRRLGTLVVAAVVLLASLAGAIGSWVASRHSGNNEVALAKAANLTLADFPSSWYVAASSPISYLVPTAGEVYASTTSTTAPKKNTVFDEAASVFQKCLGVTNAQDRVYGLAGQQPDYQVSSKIFSTNDLGGLQVATTSQYYRTTEMVARDTREMSKTNFGKCFVASSADIVLSVYGKKNVAISTAENWQPTTFLKGWSRGGVVPLDVPGLSAKLELVQAEVTHGHFELTLTGLVGSFAKARGELNQLVSTLISRTLSDTATAA